MAKTLPDQVEMIISKVEAQPEPEQSVDTEPAPRRSRDGFGPVQLARQLDIKDWQLRRAQDRGLIPAPDIDERRWSAAAIESIPGRDTILADVGDHPGIGSSKAAEYLSGRTGLQIERADVQALAERGALRPIGDYKGWSLYALDDLDALSLDLLVTVLADRQSWLQASLTSPEAADLLGWSVGRFEVTAERQGLTAGRFGRYARVDVERLR
ncbi:MULTISPECIES: hypothetical protein [Parafrankia]|uniref:hypothetical protein n=1 Tax=Parafrankia TaxID=2994362 RepID=UPI001A960599|nr:MULTISPECIES: hypothetical protein [Parafrankia]